jgi:hypothetical protein
MIVNATTSVRQQTAAYDICRLNIGIGGCRITFV